MTPQKKKTELLNLKLIINSIKYYHILHLKIQLKFLPTRGGSLIIPKSFPPIKESNANSNNEKTSLPGKAFLYNIPKTVPVKRRRTKNLVKAILICLLLGRKE